MATAAHASPSPSRSPDPAAREAGAEWPEPARPPSAPGTPPEPHSAATAVVVVASQTRAAAAKYVPPRAATRTADPAPGGGGAGGWYSWSGARTAERAPPRRQRAAEVPPPPPAPAPAPAPFHAPAPAPPPPPPAPVQAQPQTRSVDRAVSTIMSRKRRAAALQRTALVARGAAAGLCLAAFAVLAADTRKGWALDSYSHYSQLRYSEAVNVIGFVYSVLQFIALAGNKHLIPHRKRDLFDFAMDQRIQLRIISPVLPDLWSVTAYKTIIFVLAYLLISSSSSATARVGDWVDNWGSDPFPNMANGSIAISFLAFLVFAICSLISAYNLFRLDM
ncbi:hypothetical protein ACP4OV_009568 [Aristida adscensionis]